MLIDLDTGSISPTSPKHERLFLTHVFLLDTLEAMEMIGLGQVRRVIPAHQNRVIQFVKEVAV